MVNTNKILTVSYGTFSCTLEGFEDSFDTMKAIAEYFRDLAADDRYFGAEPPTPDADMLARIAEREIARRVEAEIDDQSIHLRATPGAALPAAEPIEETPEAASADVAEEEVVAEAAEGPVAHEETVELAEEAEAPAEETVIEAEQDIAVGEAEEEQPFEWPTEDAGAFFESDEDTAEDIAAPSGEVESVAAKLSRIRAVVSQEEAAEKATSPEMDYSEDEHAEEFAEEFLAEAHEDIEAALSIDDEAEEARAIAWDEEEPGDTDEISALLDRFGAEEQAGDIAQDTEEAIEAADTDQGAEEDIEAEEIQARVVTMKRADFEAALEDAEEADSGEETAQTEDDEDDILSGLATIEAELDASEAAAAQEEVEDETAEDETAADDYAEFEDEDEDADAPIDLTAFATEDEFEDEADGEDSIFAEDDSFDEELEDQQATAQSPFSADAESDVSRMFDQVDSQMDEEAGKGRRNAIAHLRAAVAAAKAEEGVGGKLKTHAPDTVAYRDDLDSVVRPRRPEASKTQTRRPDAQRPAPLKLVAEQRVDLDEVAAGHPIRPRRVSLSRTDMADDADAVGSEFADYAESVGANSLPELLEAAAAYLSFVEGRDQFSRPQLMTQVRQVEQSEFSREDGLRSFGQLLRDGKIEKLEGGRFKASENISYRPDARYAGE